MGCDIHCYVEYRNPPNPATPDEQSYWGGFPRINPGRDYQLFGYIAGVRGEGPALVELRGLPPGAGSYHRQSDYWRIVDDTLADHDGFVTRKSAESWVASGCSVWEDDTHKRVSDPDIHSHTWLTPAEFEAAVNMPMPPLKIGGRVFPYERSVEYHGLVALMKAIEARGKEVRIVIWFDN